LYRSREPRRACYRHRISGGLEREVWLEVVAGAAPDHFDNSDRVLLAAYCRAGALERRASDELAVSAIAGEQPSPWLQVHASAVRALTALSVRLRLSPKSRTPSQRATRKGPPPSYYDQMRGGG
jgi:phage terminase small subunit